MPLKCPYCGIDNADAAQHCSNCNKALSAPGTRKLELVDNRYEILNVIKSGMMGCVYRVRDTRLDNVMALKKMLSPQTDPEEIKYAEGRFRDEAKLLSKLHHGGLPKVSDFFTARDPKTGELGYYLVMTFIEGKDFETVIQERGQKPFPVNAVLDYSNQVLDILQYLHSQNPPVIYRDLNPRNMMLQNGKVFLIDFGIARIFTQQQKGTAIGTPGYASPEQYKGFAEPRSDLYSLGAVMHFLLTGANPEEASRPLFTFDPPRKLNPQVPEYLDSIIMSMLDLIPTNRPESAEKVRQQISGRIAKSAPAPAIATGYTKPCGDIFEALRKNDLNGVVGFIENGVSVHIRDKSGCTPLHKAALGGSCEIVEYLLSKGALTTARNQYHYTPIYYAETMGHQKVVDILQAREEADACKRADTPSATYRSPSKKTATARPAIPLAGIAKFATVFLLILAVIFAGWYLPGVINPQIALKRKGIDWSPAGFLECAKKGDTESVKRFLAGNMDPDSRGGAGETALHWAAGEDQPEVAKLLLQKNADVEAKSSAGLTPLHWAAEFGMKNDTMELLMAKGANVNAPSMTGWTALHWACYRGKSDKVQLLLAKNAKVDIKCDKGWTPLHCAAEEGHSQVVEMLLAKGAKVDAVDNEKWTPLLWAVSRNHFEVVKLLIAKGAQVNAKDKDGWTTLHWAAQEGSLDMVKLLVSNGAKMNIKNGEGKVPVTYAKEQKHKEVVSFLSAKAAH